LLDKGKPDDITQGKGELMVTVKPLEECKQNYRSGASVAPARYTEAIKRVTDWQQKAIDGEALFQTKMSRVLSRRLREDGVKKVSNAQWQNAALTKGAARIGSGMLSSVDFYASGWSPYRTALEAVVLPARSADPMINIDRRVKPIVQAMVDTKEATLPA